MIGYAETPRAWWLTRGMARLTGLDLPAAVLDGWLRPAEVSALVNRCAACGRTECESAMTSTIPGFCPNKPGLEALGK